MGTDFFTGHVKLRIPSTAAPRCPRQLLLRELRETRGLLQQLAELQHRGRRLLAGDPTRGLGILRGGVVEKGNLRETRGNPETWKPQENPWTPIRNVGPAKGKKQGSSRRQWELACPEATNVLDRPFLVKCVAHVLNGKLHGRKDGKHQSWETTRFAAGRPRQCCTWFQAQSLGQWCGPGGHLAQVSPPKKDRPPFNQQSVKLIERAPTKDRFQNGTGTAPAPPGAYLPFAVEPPGKNIIYFQ